MEMAALHVELADFAHDDKTRDELLAVAAMLREADRLLRHAGPSRRLLTDNSLTWINDRAKWRAGELP